MIGCAIPRVLQIVSHLALGGAERVAFVLARGLRQRFDFGFYAATGVDPGDVGQSMKRELEALRIPLFVGTKLPIKWGGMAMAGALSAIAVKRFRPDIIHLHTEVPEASYAAMVSLRPSLRRVPVVRTIHNAVYWPAWRTLGRWCDRRMRRSFVAAVGRDASKAFEQLRGESSAGPPPHPPVVIFNGVSVVGEPRPAAKLPTGRMRILFAGRFEDQKGADLIPRIVGQVRPPHDRPCELVIRGSGPHEPALRDLASHPPSGWAVDVNGPLPGLSARLAEFDLLLMPSRFEGLALLAIEAALMGLPVIATDGPGIREGFPEGFPWLAKAGDADSFAQLLQAAVNDPASCRSGAEAAQRFARANFGVETMIEGYAQLYGRAAGSGKR